jgi:hypothetical protein
MRNKFLLVAASAFLAVQLSASAVVVVGNGAVQLRNDDDTHIGSEIQLNGVNTSVNVYVQVLAASWDGTSPLFSMLSPSLTPVALNGTPTTVFSANLTPFFEGTFNAGGSGLGIAPFDVATGKAQFEIIAWQGGPGSTFNTATIRGQSAVWGQETGLAPTGITDPGTPKLLQIPLANINLAVVPEPSTIALAVLGGLGLLLRRRK